MNFATKITFDDVIQCGANISEKCLCSHHNNTASIKQISMCDTALGHDKFLNFQLKSKEKRRVCVFYR